MSNALRDNETPREIALRREVANLRETLVQVQREYAERLAGVEMRNDELMRMLSTREMLRPPPTIVVQNVDEWRNNGGRPDSSEIVELRRREPTFVEMDLALKLAESNGKDETFIPPGWCVRRCRHCRAPVAGGPTACITCVHKRELAERGEQMETVLRDAMESGQIVVQAMVDYRSAESFVSVPLGTVPTFATSLRVDGSVPADAELIGLAFASANLAAQLAATHPSDARGFDALNRLTETGRQWRAALDARHARCEEGRCVHGEQCRLTHGHDDTCRYHDDCNT